MFADPAVRRPLISRSRLAAWSAAAALALLAGAPVSLAQTEAGANGAPKTDGWVAIIDGSEVPAPDIKMGDRETILKILDEGKNRNQVMKHLEHLTKQIGHRLTGSTSTEKANRWCADLYKSWGLQNVHLEEWGTIPVRFDRGACTGRIVVAREGGFDPVMELEFTTYSWSAGTNGAVRGPVVKMPTSEEEYKAVKDRLKGAWVLLPEAEAGGTGMRRAGVMSSRYRASVEARAKVEEEKIDPAVLPVEDRVLFDGINGFVAPTRELVITGGIPNWRRLDPNKIPPDINIGIRKAHYDDIVKRLDASESFQLEFDLQHKFTPGPIPCYNTIAEIPGTTWPEQVVIVSGHLDSWDGPGSEGCTDNGTGTCTTLETARILMAVGAKPKRTIRFIDWTGEEQGLLGSAAYVDKHKDDIVKNVSACLVDDGGTNYDGGLPAAEQMVQMLAAATAPINNVFFSETDNKFLNVNIRALKTPEAAPDKRLRVSGGSDHMSFNRVGVPGFFWDETGRANYTYTHHTQYDKLDQAVPEYLVQSSTCAAVTAYNLACADELLPRSIQPPPRSPDEVRPAGPSASTEPLKAKKQRRITP